MIADEVAKLEEKAKELPGKDAVTVFGTGESTWHWEDFTQRVIQEKYKELVESINHEFMDFCEFKDEFLEADLVQESSKDKK